MAAKGSSHEDFSRKNDVKGGSDRAFGFVFTVVFIIIGAFPLIDGGEPRIWAFGVAGGFLAVSLIYPKALKPLNIIWTKFGLLLHMIVSPVIMGLMFFVAVTPTGLIMRALGKDPMRLSFDKDAKSYWIDRDPPDPVKNNMKNQF